MSERPPSFGSDPEMAVAQSGDPLRRGREDPFAVVDQDEVVSGSFVFCKFQLHHSDVESRQIGNLTVVPGTGGIRSDLFVQRFILRKNSKTSKSFATFVKNIRRSAVTSGGFVLQACILIGSSMKSVLFKHRSIRKFRPTPIPDEVLQECLEAATRASTCGNMQL